MTADTHAYELPSDVPGLDDAVDDATAGEVVYLTRHGERIAAVVPLQVAMAGAAAVEALEDAEALAATHAALAEGGKPIHADDLHSELGL